MSDSLRPHGLQPTKLLCPWDSLGKNTGVGCHALLWEIFLTLGSNTHLLCLLHYQQTLYPLRHLGKPIYIYAKLNHRRRQWDPTPVLLPGKAHGWRSLVGCSPQGRRESGTTERLPFHFQVLKHKMLIFNMEKITLRTIPVNFLARGLFHCLWF